MTDEGKPRWRVRLKGESGDLEDLAALFTSPTLRVVRDGDEFFLESAGFERFSDSAAVHEEAGRIMPLLNGAARLKQRSFRDVDVDVHVVEFTGDEGRRNATVTGGSVTPKGTLRHQVISPPTIDVRARLLPPTIIVGDQEPRAPEPGSLDTDGWLELARRDADAAEALSIWGSKRHDWVNLYKVLEIIRGRADIVGRGWASRSALERFTRTAQHPEAAGEGARHARSKLNPPPRPMSPEEADHFIGDILTRWLGSVV